MSDAPRGPSLSRTDLLQIERICDRFEDELRCGVADELEAYIAAAPPLIHEILREELTKLEPLRRKKPIVGATWRDAKSVRGVGPTLRASHSADRESDPPQVLCGRFELLQRLGSGGNGVVWRALDQRLRRQVAVKFPRRDAIEDSERFLREAHAAARLQHPNIVRVHEVGEEDGSYFLVSELIEGESLASRLRAGAMSIRGAAQLAAKVADAVAYSHEQGVIHRDIKPQNILLDSEDCPYVTDFGLAKNVRQNDATLTHTGEIVGTPAYMAPEQATGDGVSADERTDVYSLGVMLFQLLTGDVPFRGSLESVVYQVVYVDCPTPRLWNGGIPVDLETVCLKCLEKEPSKRFASAGDLKAELDRFLAGLPIRSRRATILDHAAKWARRNPGVASLATALVVLLAAVAFGASAAAVQWKSARDQEHALRVTADDARVQESRAKSQAVVARRAAEMEAKISRETANFMQSIFETSDPASLVLSGLGGGPSNLSEVLEEAARRIPTEFQSQPRVRARLMDTLGNACRAVGKFETAEGLIRGAAEVRDNANAEPATGQQLLEFCENRFFLAWLKHDLDELESAEQLYRGALARLDSNDDSMLRLKSTIHFHLGRLLLEQRRNDEATAAFGESIALQQESATPTRLLAAAKMGLLFSEAPVGASPSFSAIAPLLAGEDWAAAAAGNLARMFIARQRGELDTACREYRAALDIVRERMPAKSPIYLLGLGDYASLLWERGNYREAYPLAVELSRIAEELAPTHRHHIGLLTKMGDETLRGGRFDEAAVYYGRLQKLLGAEQLSQDVRQGMLWTDLARGKFEEALVHSRYLVDRKGLTAQQTAWFRYAHARVLAKMGRETESRRYDTKAYQTVLSILPEAMQHSIWTDRLSQICLHNDDPEAARRLAERAYELESRLRPADHPRIADRLFTLAEALELAGEVGEAIELLERAEAIRRKQLPEDDQRIPATVNRLARLREKMGEKSPVQEKN